MPRVLFVDSHASTRAICCQFLQTHGHEVIEARNGRTAIVLARSQYLEAVITDWVLPDMSGQQFFRELADLKQSPPVIVYSNQPHLCPSALLGTHVKALVAKSEEFTNLLWALQELCRISQAASQQQDTQLRLYPTN